MEEKSYPIYHFYACWDQVGFNNNATDYSLMFKEEQTEDQLQSELNNLKLRTENKLLEKEQPIIKWHKLEYKFIGYEPWMLSWFYHMTYNKFENDEQTLESFRKFIFDKECENESNGHYTSYDGHTERNSNSTLPYYCFMGADDRWRWELCHCDGCKKNDWTVVKH